MHDPHRPVLRFLTRVDCGLCAQGRAALQEALEERAAAGRLVPRVEEVDIDTDAVLLRRNLERLPVLELGSHVLPLALSGRAIRRFLDERLDRALA
ncbi:MAG TPA: glutaredoxin family protein [Nonomuraea sp.]|nr:glutaredoxin family protein [Nonomuraea sp.]